jgi:hypothetical protein
MSKANRIMANRIHVNKFKASVESTPDVQACFHPGLRALGAYSTKIRLGATNLCYGSIDIDTCVSRRYPHDNRWDYVFDYNERLYFVEVHSAETSEVSVVLRKLQWLKDWLDDHAPRINSLPKGNPGYYWIQSGRFNIPQTTPQYRKITQAGINLKPISVLNIV